jgi:hypothetical protein
MTFARSILFAMAVTGVSAAGAAAQTTRVALDGVYEPSQPIYATTLALYATPEIALAAPVDFVIREPGLGQRELPRKHEFIAPAFYGDVVSRGDYPSLTASRCVTDLGFGRWEACD